MEPTRVEIEANNCYARVAFEQYCGRGCVLCVLCVCVLISREVHCNVDDRSSCVLLTLFFVIKLLRFRFSLPEKQIHPVATMSVHYKFKAGKDSHTITFDNLHISLGELKKSIMQQQKMGKSTDLDLQITNALTKEGKNRFNVCVFFLS